MLIESILGLVEATILSFFHLLLVIGYHLVLQSKISDFLTPLAQARAIFVVLFKIPMEMNPLNASLEENM